MLIIDLRKQLHFGLWLTKLYFLVREIKNEHFLDKIKEMDVVVQEELAKDIQQIKENGTNIVAFQDVAESTIE